MDYLVKSGNPEKQRTGCVIVGVFDRRKPSVPAATLDRAAGGALGRALRRGDLDGKSGQTLALHALPKLHCDRVLLVGTARPGLPDRWASGVDRLDHAHRMLLRRLGPKDLVRLLAIQVAANYPTYVDVGDVPGDVLDAKKRELLDARARLAVRIVSMPCSSHRGGLGAQI